MFVVVKRFASHDHTRTIVCTDASFWWERIQPTDTFHGSKFNHCLGNTTIWQTMIHRAESFFDDTNGSFNLWNMLLSCTIIHGNVDVGHGIFKKFEFWIHKQSIDNKSGFIIDTKYCIKCCIQCLRTPVRNKFDSAIFNSFRDCSEER